MARARNIKPAFFQNEDLAELDFATRLCFIGLWTEADKDGKLEDRPKRLKMTLFPGDNVDMEQMLCDLARYGFIRRYQVGELRLIRITKWHLHQSPHHTEKQSILPDESEQPLVNGEVTVNSRNQHGENPPDSLIPDSYISLSKDARDENSDPITPDNHPLDFDENHRPDNSGYQTSQFDAADSCTGEQLRFTDQHLLLARTTGLGSDYSDADIKNRFDLFRCYKANANTLKTQSVWLSDWRTWCQREKVQHARQNSKSGSGQSTGAAKPRNETGAQRAMRLAQEASERLAGNQADEGH